MVINPVVSQSPWGTGQQALWNTISQKSTMKVTTNKNICKQNENKLFYYYYNNYPHTRAIDSSSYTLRMMQNMSGDKTSSLRSQENMDWY